MNPAYLSALSALAGSAIGATASFATTWLTTHAQDRAMRIAQTRARREMLYGEFIDEATRLFVDALSSELTDLAKLVHVYGIVSKMRLFASPIVVRHAEAIIDNIVATYHAPTLTAVDVTRQSEHWSSDPLKAFSESCRAEIS